MSRACDSSGRRTTTADVSTCKRSWDVVIWRRGAVGRLAQGGTHLVNALISPHQLASWGRAALATCANLPGRRVPAERGPIRFASHSSRLHVVLAGIHPEYSRHQEGLVYSATIVESEWGPLPCAAGLLIFSALFSIDLRDAFSQFCSNQ